MKNFAVTYNEETTTYWLEVNGVDAGFLEEGAGNNNCMQIGKVEIFPEFKGKGLYRTFLSCILQIGKVKQFYSDDRNETSNEIWERWTGEELDFTDMCYVDLNTDGTLDFLAEKSL